MRCDDVRMMVAGEPALGSGAGAAPALAAALGDHLAVCDGCRRVREDQLALDARLRADGPEVPLPYGLRRRVLEAAAVAVDTRATASAWQLGWAGWGVTLATLAVVGWLVAVRLSESPAGSFVRLELPAGTTLAREPEILLQRGEVSR